MTNKTKGILACLICAMVWGFAFSAQSSAMDHVGPCTFIFLRSAISCVSLLIVRAILDRFGLLQARERTVKPSRRRFLLTGMLCGAALCLGSLLQQIGLVTTTPAKSGFITALYIIIVPMLGLFTRRFPSIRVWAGACIAIVGMYLLCMSGRFHLETGDLLTLLCALAFALHIIVVDRFGKPFDPVMLSAVQFATSAVIGAVLTFMFETPTLPGIRGCMGSLLYAAIASGAVGYTLQIVGQQYLDPAPASLLLCLESVFAALGGWLFLHNTLSGRELIGCALMFVATIIALLPGKTKA